MLILCSNGLSSEKLQTYIRSKMIGCKNAALVVTADNEYKENIKFYTEKCGFKIISIEMDGNVKVVRFILEKEN